MAGDLLSSTLGHLAWLVAAPTENPPRRIHESGIMDRLANELGAGFQVNLRDLGDGSVYLFARRGDPRLLWNFHLDTVPAATDWTGSPFELTVEGGKAVGLGACDIKGAAAAMLAVVQATKSDVALLFSTDEEAGPGRCIPAFLETRAPFDGVIVAEPTKRRAVLAHRGIGTASGRFLGRAGHASQAGALENSAAHEAVRWAARALEHAEKAEKAGGPLPGLRFNLGRIEGGDKPNVVAAETRVRFGVRPPPGTLPREALAALQALAPTPARVEWQEGFIGVPLPSGTGPEIMKSGEALARWLDLEIADAVDFWTEAALFSAAGYPALVFGPGDIAQAHSRNEWVSTDDLAAAAATYERILRAEGSGSGPRGVS